MGGHRHIRGVSLALVLGCCFFCDCLRRAFVLQGHCSLQPVSAVAWPRVARDHRLGGVTSEELDGVGPASLEGGIDSQAMAAVSPGGISARHRIPLGFSAAASMVQAFTAGPLSASANEELPVTELTKSYVIDNTNLLAPSTEKYIDGLFKALQSQTGLKVRLLCPASGLQDNREAFRAFLKPINKPWGVDSSTLIILAEERIQKKYRRTLPLLNIQPGYRLQEKFQYRLTQDFVLGTADKFGFPDYVKEQGADLAIQDAAENVVAGLFVLSDSPSSRLLAPLEPADVKATLKRHGL